MEGVVLNSRMARMYSRKKGRSGSVKPIQERKHVWVTYDIKTVEQLVEKLSKSGKSASEIGIVLRDSYGIPDVNKVATKGQMIYFNQSSAEMHLTSISNNGSYLVLAGKPINEPIARYGPFVANTEGEVKQAMLDFQTGKMGKL